MTLHYCLLDEPLIGVRLAADGSPAHFTLPGLFVALGSDSVRDFPALRPHQRHPWHAFLVQLAAMALHRAGRSQPFESEGKWKKALLALTPDHLAGEAWCLVAPHDRPAFMQAPVPGGDVSKWKGPFPAPDMIDMLVTSKNHDLKAARSIRCEPDDWLMALISLQTQEGYFGSGKYGISRMNGPYASRVASGAAPKGHFGRRWQRDVQVLLGQRGRIVDHLGLKDTGGIKLVWLETWTGALADSLPFSSLDPLYIEICRRIRLLSCKHVICAKDTTSKSPRIAPHEPKGNTGDLWTPIDTESGDALKIKRSGFDYTLASAVIFGNKFRDRRYCPSGAQLLTKTDGNKGAVILMQGMSRGGPKGNKSVTEGYHERRIPVSPKVRSLLVRGKTDVLARVAAGRVQDIAKIRSVLWTALATLFDNGTSKERFSDGAKDKANDFVKPFEQGEDARFFEALNAEMESDQPKAVRLSWYLSMAERAEAVLKDAFDAGPRSGEQRYRARAAALDRLRSGLRSEKVLPTLAHHYRQQRASKETDHVPA